MTISMVLLFYYINWIKINDWKSSWHLENRVTLRMLSINVCLFRIAQKTIHIFGWSKFIITDSKKNSRNCHVEFRKQTQREMFLESINLLPSSTKTGFFSSDEKKARKNCCSPLYRCLSLSKKNGWEFNPVTK